MNGLEDISLCTDVRTYVRTDGRDSLGLKRLRRETKNVKPPFKEFQNIY